MAGRFNHRPPADGVDRLDAAEASTGCRPWRAAFIGTRIFVGAISRRSLMGKIFTGRILAIVGVGAIACTGMAAAGAQALPKEGRFDYVACWSGTSNPMSFSKTLSAMTYEHTGSTRSNLPDSPFDKLSFRCLGMATSFDGKASNATVCEAVDKDGDKVLTHFVLSEGKTVRSTVGGTGKFEGITTEASVAPLGPFPTIKAGTFQSCNHQTGTYRFK
jgi:hypothetical protein